MSVRVEDVTPSKSGKALRVKLSGKWYGASKDSGLQEHKGKEIEAVISTTEWGPWIDGFKPVGVATPVSTPAPAPSGPSYIAEPQTQVAPNISEGELRFISNCVGQAITAGKCATPSEVTIWALGAKAALKALV